MAQFKTGRRANDADRQIAAEWAALYRQAQQSPDGWVCVNPQDEPEAQARIYADDVGFLVSMLEGFAETGTFQSVNRAGIADVVLSIQFNGMKRKGVGYTEAIAELADMYDCSTRTIERRLTDKT